MQHNTYAVEGQAGDKHEYKCAGKELQQRPVTVVTGGCMRTGGQNATEIEKMLQQQLGTLVSSYRADDHRAAFAVELMI